MRRVGPATRPLLPALLLGVFLPTSAEAHSTGKGLNDFWAGALHPVMTPPHVLILLALGLGLGQRVSMKIGLPLGVFASAAALGLAATAPGWISGIHPAALSGFALVAGALVASEWQLPRVARAAFFGMGALLISLDSGVEPGTRRVVLVVLLGTWISLTVLLMNITHFVLLAAEQPKKWMHIGIRVVGSWIVAISLLMLAFALRR
jgi:urease accessory protein